MEEAHNARAITDDAFDRVAEHLADTLAELGVPGETIGETAGALAPLRGEVVQAPVAGVRASFARLALGAEYRRAP